MAWLRHVAGTSLLINHCHTCTTGFVEEVLEAAGEIGVKEMGNSDEAATPQESEAVQCMRAALQNVQGTATERRNRLQDAWTFLRASAAANFNLQGSSTSKNQKWLIGKQVHRREKKRKVELEDADPEGQLRKSTTDEREKSLHEASRAGELEQVVGMLKEGVHISCKDELGYSSLHWAALCGHVHVVRALLGAGAGDGKRINRKTITGNTPLHFACTGQHAKVAALLQLYKPDVYAVNKCGQTPVSLGLRKLVAAIEEEQRLAQVQALRNQDYFSLLVRENDFEQQISDREAPENEGSSHNTNSRAWLKWEAYQTAWRNFLMKYEFGCSAVSWSSNESEGAAMEFENVPWPFIERRRHRDGEELLLGHLHISGVKLHSLIQQERLRWHPDKFLQVFSRRLSGPDRDAILLGVQTVSQLLNSLASEQNSTS